MAQFRPKQMKLSAPGDLLVADANSSGSVVSATGNEGKVLRVVSGMPVWSQDDHIVSDNGFNKATAIDGTGVVVAVQNASGNASTNLVTFQADSPSDENLVLSSAAGQILLTAKGTATDVDVVIAPQGSGEVIIGNTGPGLIQADDNDDLAIWGGTGSGNLYINGGGTGKVFYANDSSDATKEVATVGDIALATLTATRSQFTGDQTFTLNTKTVAGSIIAFINGLSMEAATYTYNSNTNVVAFDSSALGFTLDSSDKVVFTYEITA